MGDSVIRQVIEFFTKGYDEAYKKQHSMNEAVQDFGEIGEKASEVGERVREAVGKIGNSSSSANSGLSKFVTSLKRIFLYRAVRKVLSEVAKAMKEGTNNIYYYSKSMGSLDTSSVKSNMDSLATSVLYIKNSLGASLAPVIQSLTPMFTSLADTVANCGNKIAEMFAIIKGTSTYTAAKKFGTTYEKSLGNASSSAKELKRTLMGFDEINRLDAPDSGSGGSGYTSGDYGNMFEEKQTGTIQGNLSGIVETTKSAFDKVTETISKIDWLHLVPNTVKKIKEFLKKSFTNVDFEGLVKSFFTMTGSIVSAIFQFFAGLGEELRKGAKYVKEYFAKKGGGDIVWGIFEGIKDAIVGIYTWIVENVFNPFWNGFCNAFGIHSPSEKMKYIGKNIVYGIRDGLVNTWNELLSKVNDLCSRLSEKFSSFKSTLTSPFTNAFSTIRTEVSNFTSHIKSVLGGLNFKINTPHFSWSKDEYFGASGLPNWAQKALSVLNLDKIPKLKVSWYAKGGIVDGATLIGAGERGAEAIVPLENNTEWLDKIADRLISAQGNQNIVLNVDGKQLFDIMVGRNNSIVRTSGRSPLLV